MFSDIRNFMTLNNASNLDCIQSYTPLISKNDAPTEEINYYLDHRICLSNLISDS
jgi:hypothetical protein